MSLLIGQNAIVPSGGITFSGSAPFTYKKNLFSTGQLVFNGTAPLGPPYLYVMYPSGQLDFSGAADASHSKTVSPSGTLTFSGSAPMTLNTPGVAGFRTLMGVGS